MTDTDGVSETFDDSLRIALTVASQFGERISRLREQHAREREASARQEARELEARFDAEPGAARAQLATVNQPEWWERASVQDIAAVHETATVWREHDDTAADASETIRREIRERYGIDVDDPRADPTAIAAALTEAERDRARAAEERRRAGEERTASQVLLAGAEARDRDADDAAVRASAEEDPAEDVRVKQDADVAARESRADRDESSLAYDSAERRQAFARSLEGDATAEQVAGRVRADAGNAKHPERRSRPRRGARRSRARVAAVSCSSATAEGSHGGARESA